MRPALSRCVVQAAGLGLGLVLALPSWAGGTVQVEFKQPDRYTDIGFATVERETNLKTLAGHMKRWEERLPDGQRLEIEVLDVDLAGEVRPWRALHEVRILRGRIDWPRMNLRWALKAGDQVLKSGDERIADMAYLGTSARLRYPEALAYDTRMLDDWLRTRVLAADVVR
ncbi:MAG: DUF3016 domain-containing protein [Rubrivivax sp.]|nr:DUF3016 domain-containing protein [Rubrivivax sp.]